MVVKVWLLVGWTVEWCRCYLLSKMWMYLLKEAGGKHEKHWNTLKNKNHVDTFWGENGKANVKRPTLIDDYNHWMGGFDLSDQRISYYHPDIRCRRNWVPICIQLLSIIRNNSFLVMKRSKLTVLCTDKLLVIKQRWLSEWIMSLF